MEYNREMMTITTDRLVLRLFDKTDAERVATLCDNYNIYKSTLYLPHPYKIEDALTWIEYHYENFVEDRSYELAVTDKETRELYGAIALSHNKHFNQGELAYWIGEPYWGKGYATEAAQAIVQFAFKEKRCTKCLRDILQQIQLQGK